MPINFNNANVISFESRRADDMADLIRRAHGSPISAPTMRETPLTNHEKAIDFAQKLFDNQIDILILLTGNGTRMLVDAVTTRFPKDQFTTALSNITLAARGPKPVAALREINLTPDITAPEPNTWQDLLNALTQSLDLTDKRIAVQEYGLPNDQLITALQQHTPHILRVPIYRWELPEDLAPLRFAIQSLIKGGADYALFTSATQVYHLFQIAEEDGHADALKSAFATTCIGSVGPIASDAIRHHGLTPDYEPDAPHMSILIREFARRGPDLLTKKRTASHNNVNTNNWQRVDMRWPDDPASPANKTIEDSVFLKACRCEPTPYTPVWVMRQAGRYQREYRDRRRGVTMVEFCKDSQTAAEVTLMAVDRLGADAAIIFQDILLPIECLGLNLEYIAGDGPVIDNPIRERRDLNRLTPGDVAQLDYIYEAVRITRRALQPDVALIGFSGSPFTVASYCIEGGKSSNYQRCKTMMYADDATWHGFMDQLVPVLIDYLLAQIEAGADAIQLFDSWAGALSPDDYREFVLPHLKRMISAVRDRYPNTPIINFATGNPALIPMLAEANPDVVGLDWRCDLADAWKTIGYDKAVMGNLDPITLYASPTQLRRKIQQILDKAQNRSGHIFNLGHGLSPDMNPTHVAELVDAVHELSAR